MTNSTRHLRIGYVMSRFPKLSETFILMEMLTLESRGVEIVVYPLISEKPDVVHPEAKRLAAAGFRVGRPRWLRIAGAQARWLTRHPGRYIAGWWTVVHELWRSPQAFVRAIAVLPLAAAMAADMVDRGVNHVHAHFANHPTVAANFISRLTAIPYSFTAHAHDIYIDRRMLRRKIRDAAFAVAISSYNQRLMLAEGGAPTDIIVVHCGVDPVLFRPREGSQGGGPLRVICVGALEPKKGQRYLIDAVQLLTERGVKAHLRLVGDGPGRRILMRSVAVAGLTDHVEFDLGLPRHAVADALRQSDVMVLPSVRLPNGRMEGIPVALIEAMATGLPVVSTRISGIPELVEDGVHGRLVRERDPKALADALCELEEMGIAQRAEMGRRGRERVMRDFNLHATAGQLLARIEAIQR